MAEGTQRSRAQPTAVGPHRRRRTRAERIRALRHRRRRRFIGGLAVGVLVVVVVAAVFVGSRLWHTVFGPTTTTPAAASVTSSSRSTTAIRPRRSVRRCSTTAWSAPCGLRRRRARQQRDLGDPAGLLPDAHRDPGQVSGAAPRRPHNRVGKLVIPEGRQLDDTTDMKTNAVTPGFSR
ncbi:aminodeoxychorismate lyase domain protein [Mycobacterium xenopi 4042]|uniref:Aminodeoxychorismate lyase domain protein n=1 Tax=Mycobacterium xenopi 4042 TaxID=1299334 RepID=X7ZKK8_MYCXE|nr:aminodeoxychorismate lyase domain protein [Mycobacterium xenopi 4042]